MQASPHSEAPTACVIDVGSNSIKVLVASLHSDGSLQVRLNHTLETRISRGITGRPPRLQANAIEAGLRAITALLAMARPFAPDKTSISATSAVRDAVNGSEFAEAVLRETGFPLEIITGQREAELIACGVLSDPAIKALPRFILSDIGGGSLEWALVDQEQVPFRQSFPLGAVRLTEQFIPQPELPVPFEIQEAIARHTLAVIGPACLRLARETPLVACGGAWNVLRQLTIPNPPHPPRSTHPRFSAEFLKSIRRTICDIPFAARVAQFNVPPARADILPAALIVIDTLSRAVVAKEWFHTYHNLRFGLARERLRKAPPTP